jgi:hypothetical protein
VRVVRTPKHGVVLSSVCASPLVGALGLEIGTSNTDTR